MKPSPTRHNLIHLLLLLVLLVTACSRKGEPNREEIDGVEHVRNRIRPIYGESLPDPVPAESMLLLEGGSGDIPAWSAVRDVRATPGGAWTVIDMHHTEVTWFDRWGNLIVSMDLGAPPIGLTSPVAAAFMESGGACVDMALRRAVFFNSDGTLISTFELAGGLPMDLDIGMRGDIYVLGISRPAGGREQVTQVRRYDIGGTPRQIAGVDSLLLEHRVSDNIPRPIPISLTAGPHGYLYAAALDYTIYQVGPLGERRIITRPSIESRIPDYVLEQRRTLMQRRVSSQQRDVSIVEPVEVVQVVALDNGGVLVQTNEWHPLLLDKALNQQVLIVLLDIFSEDGAFMRRYAVELPLPRMLIQITDEAGGEVYGFAVPSAGEGPIKVFRFRLPEEEITPR